MLNGRARKEKSLPTYRTIDEDGLLASIEFSIPGASPMDCGDVRIGQRIVYEDYREFLDYLLDEQVGVRLGNLRVVFVAKLVEYILHY